MNMNQWLGRFLGRYALPEQKVSRTGSLTNPETAYFSMPAARWMGRNPGSLVNNGFRKNVIANRSVRLIAECAASVPFILMEGERRIQRHPLLDLLSSPNPLQSGVEFLEAVYAHLQISGNSYLEMVTRADDSPGELYILRPDRMSVVPGADGWPSRYLYKIGGRSMSFPVDWEAGVLPILHLKTFHPTDDFYGLSPLEAAAFGIDIHNAAQNWNKALLDNAARPSGALVFEPKDGEPGSLSDDQFKRLKGELEDHYQGAGNAGRPFLLEGGLKWQQIAFSPQDMEFIQSKHVAAREIALAFGVPPMLLGIPGDNTYSNYAEANRALWRLTILPLLEKTTSALGRWLAQSYGEDLALTFDKDAIPALVNERTALWSQINAADFLTADEKRKALGLGPIDDGEVPSANGAPTSPFLGSHEGTSRHSSSSGSKT